MDIMLIQNTNQSSRANLRDNVLDRFLYDICETDPRNEKIRIEQSKGRILGQCYDWVFPVPRATRVAEKQGYAITMA